MNVFPTKVWEPTDETEDGIRLWSSRAVTRADVRKRTDLLIWLDPFESQAERDAARERLHPW